MTRCHGWQGAAFSGLAISIHQNYCVGNDWQGMYKMYGMTRCRGQFFAPAKIAFPPSMVVMARSGVFRTRYIYSSKLLCRERLTGYV